MLFYETMIRDGDALGGSGNIVVSRHGGRIASKVNPITAIAIKKTMKILVRTTQAL